MLMVSVGPVWQDGARRRPRLRAVLVGPEWIVLELRDGRRLRVPTAWSAPLADASVGERAEWRRFGAGTGVVWPALGEVLVLRLVAGARRRPPTAGNGPPPPLRLAMA